MRTERTALDEDAFGALAFFTFAGLVLGEDDLVVPRFERAERIVVFVEDDSLTSSVAGVSPAAASSAFSAASRLSLIHISEPTRL